jgi:hypothetical protein
MTLVETAPSDCWNPKTYLATPPDFGCKLWEGKSKGPFRIKGNSVQFFTKDGFDTASALDCPEHLEAWLNDVWKRYNEPRISLHVNSYCPDKRGNKYQVIVRFGYHEEWEIGKRWATKQQAEDWIHYLELKACLQ